MTITRETRRGQRRTRKSHAEAPRNGAESSPTHPSENDVQNRMADALDVLNRFVLKQTPEHKQKRLEALVDARVAMAVYDLRADAGLGYADFASRVGLDARSIRDLEDEEYKGCPVCELYKIYERLGTHPDKDLDHVRCSEVEL